LTRQTFVATTIRQEVVIKTKRNTGTTVAQCRKLINDGNYEKLIKLANTRGFTLYQQILTSSPDKAHLLLHELKQIILITLESMTYCRCPNCRVKYVLKVIDLFRKMKASHLLSVEIRQRSGAFLNELVHLDHLQSIRHLIPENLLQKRNHLIIA
jgi:hypothetical protein